jgi:nitroreductase
MDIITAIHTRQSISKVAPDPVPHELVEKLLSAAVQAPNHFHVRPWRFIVIRGEGRNRLGDVMAQALKVRAPETLEQALEVERARPLRAPLLIAVGVDKPSTPREVELENICAAAAAAENMLLAAHGLGLSAMWRTGAAASEPAVKTFLGLAPDQPLIAFIYVGYPLAEQTPVERPSFEDRTTWIDR